jgi:hypothetical protein
MEPENRFSTGAAPMNRSVLPTAAFVVSALSITFFTAEAQQKKAEPPKAAPAKNAAPQPAPKPAEAPKQVLAKAGAKITITGCASVGTPPTCVVMRGADGGHYEVTAARFAPPLDGNEVRLTGTVTDNVSICMQGRVLRDVEWTKTGKRCK